MLFIDRSFSFKDRIITYVVCCRSCGSFFWEIFILHRNNKQEILKIPRRTDNIC